MALIIWSLEKKVKALAFWGDERKVRREMAVGAVKVEERGVGWPLRCWGSFGGGGVGLGREGTQNKVGGGLAAVIVRKAMTGGGEKIWISVGVMM